MSEYWKSTPKYWCKHCSTYVKDTPFERKQHENTGKHQGNLKRFLRGIQNDHERAERDKQKAKAEVDRVNKVVGGSTSSSANSGPSTSNRKSTPSTYQASPADRKRQLEQLAEMGVAVPDEYRANMALAGDWQVVSQRKIEEADVEEPLSIGIRKRKFEGQEDEEEADEAIARRGWGTTTKRYPGNRPSDLDALLSTNMLKKEDQAVESNHSQQDPLKHESEEEHSECQIKTEESEVELKPSLDSDLTTEMSKAPAVPVFKRRRPKSTV